MQVFSLGYLSTYLLIGFRFNKSSLLESDTTKFTVSYPPSSSSDCVASASLLRFIDIIEDVLKFQSVTLKKFKSFMILR